MTRVFAYLRVSSDIQMDKGGFERQTEAVCAFILQKGWQLVRTFKDQQSGADEFADRKALQDILLLAGPNTAVEVDTIVVERADRIARDLLAQEIFLRECRKRSIKVYAADSGEELVLAGADPTRVLIRQILGALAQWEKSQISLKLQAGRRKKARETGRPCGGPPPYGATSAERAVIEEIFYARRYKKTFIEITRILNEKGFPTPSGGRSWAPSTVWEIYFRERKYQERRKNPLNPS